MMMLINLERSVAQCVSLWEKSLAEKAFSCSPELDIVPYNELGIFSNLSKVLNV
jgi:hypothetical protein